ncbi:hypothetical protein LIS44_04180 [Acinetobacter haemolyticus]|uniref:hypothetical protein n=1 Tax=unclassified Acinetobacter TaxID=196816 RepID=UPI0015D1FF29|nr:MULTISPECIES: hypothetical protein [unclassified Acinetobacter]MDD2944456.1 hypothetical protein [Acinetobacter sp.]QQN38665.1 hypothetical protein JFY49_11735 [Acinetobacter sp. CS-2]UDM38956.1 hypothetical protein LIS44_04180 [Acinetobacter haemolyticus]
MTQSWNNTRFKKSCLASMLAALLSPSVYALESLSDDHLSETTGEGVALALENFKMVFQGPNEISQASSYGKGIVDPGQYDTGFIRIIPTGENYELLGQRAYTKIYNKAYTDAYLSGKAANYNGVYENTYQSAYNTYRTNNYTTVNTTVKNNYTAEYRGNVVQSYVDSPLMKQYYQQRYDDYYDGNLWPLSVKDDGTTEPGSAESTLWLKDKSQQYATKNTLEMIELLYGNRSTESIPTTTYSQSVTRQNTIDTTVANQLEAKTQAVLNQQAAEYAKSVATTASNTALAEVEAEAIRLAKLAAAQATVGSLRTKADVFIYGLALSKSDGSLSTRYSNQGFNWGTAANPWLIRAGNVDTIQFAKGNKANVGYIALEAPLKLKGTDTSDTFKLGFWSDIFSRQLNSSNMVDPLTGAPTSGLDKDYRLRTQFIANGLNLNGSQVRLFQTLPATSNANYNQTLGMAAILRLNTHDDPSTLKATDADLDARGIRMSTAAKKGPDSTPDLYDGTAVTPAIDRSLAPIFNDVEGMYLYSPNINLVLGNMYQPFILGSEGNNIILEITRIPNVPEIYSQIYTYYSDTDSTTVLKDKNNQNIAMIDKDGVTYTKLSDYLKGSTCNVYSCGTEITTTANNITTTYQGRNATHSSISIGTVERSATGNLLNANKTADATGVVFKNINGQATNLGSVAIDGVLIQHLKIKTTGL